MNFFLHPEKRVLIIANLKVMFSSLSKQENLIHLPPQKFRELLRKKYLVGHEIFFLARNPYARIVSNYFDKFVYNPEAAHYQIQNCQQLYLRHLGLFVTGENPAKTKEKLKAITFAEFVRNLDALFMEDFHFAPQTSLKIGKLSWFDQMKTHLFHLMNYQVVKMESDLDPFFDDLNLNRRIHDNQTMHGDFSEYFSSDLYHQVNMIYKEDFRCLGYDQMK